MTRKCTVLQACVDTFQPGNCAGCGSEGVKINEVSKETGVLRVRPVKHCGYIRAA